MMLGKISKHKQVFSSICFSKSIIISCLFEHVQKVNINNNNLF